MVDRDVRHRLVSSDEVRTLSVYMEEVYHIARYSINSAAGGSAGISKRTGEASEPERTDLFASLEHIQPPSDNGLPRLRRLVVLQQRRGTVRFLDSVRGSGQQP